MKNLLKQKTKLLAVVLLGLVTSFTACSSDDDKVIQVSDVQGNFSGQAIIKPVSSPREDAEEVDKVNVQITADSIIIENLPFEKIVKDFIGNTEGVNIDEVLASTKVLNYGVAYTAKISEDKENTLDLLIKAEDPIQISYYLANGNEESEAKEDNNNEGEETEKEPNHTLIVSIDKESKGVYENKSLNFNLLVKNVVEKTKSSRNDENTEEEDKESDKGIYTYEFTLFKK